MLRSRYQTLTKLEYSHTSQYQPVPPMTVARYCRSRQVASPDQQTHRAREWERRYTTAIMHIPIVYCRASITRIPWQVHGMQAVVATRQLGIDYVCDHSIMHHACTTSQTLYALQSLILPSTMYNTLRHI